MKINLHLVFFFFLCFNAQILKAQDTIKVQTFTWDMSQRADVFQFPDDPNLRFRKIWMKYNMRCHDAAVGNGNVGCYEWDYSCNTFITDSTRVDSTQAKAPDHVVSGYTGNSFPYSNTPTVYGQGFVLQNSTYTLGQGATQVPIISNGQAEAGNMPTFRHQTILPAALLSSGLTSGLIRGITLGCAPDAGTLQFLRIRMKPTTLTTPNPTAPDETGWQEVYFNHANKAAGDTELPLAFYQSFNWDGTSNVVLDISYTQAPGVEPIDLKWVNTSGTLPSMQTQNVPDQALFFHGRGAMEPAPAKLSSLSNEITIMFWAYGLPEGTPTNSSVLEGLDQNNQRQINIHLPWSNSQVFWDCGATGGTYDRISKAATVAETEGRWNHWAFTKDAAGNMRIYLNGALWHSASGLTRTMDVKYLRIGSMANNTNYWSGGLNELSLWNKSLSLSEIQALKHQKITDASPSYANLLYYYPMEQGSNPELAVDLAPNPGNAKITLPAWRQVRGDARNIDLEATTRIPELKLWRGAYTINTTPQSVIDNSEQAQPVQIVGFAAQNNNLIRVDTTQAWPAGLQYVYDPNGSIVDSFQVNNTQTLNIQELTYYQKAPAKYEILSLVTPYGNGLDLGQAGKNFLFDVTDYAPILKGKKRLSLEYGGENQEELDIEFIFIKGVPERDVLEVQPIWPQRRGGFAAIQADQVFEPRTIPVLPNAAHLKIRSAITGHEQNGEFTPREHYININGGAQEFKYDVWKYCGKNPIYPQGGTWIFDRAGWCPGMATDVHEFSLDNLVQPGSNLVVDYGVNGATLASANYLVNNQLVSYGPKNFAVDAAIEAIIRPNNFRVEFARLNPMCSAPAVQIRNGGSQPITSIELLYEVEGGYSRNYTWTGSLASMTNMEITLPPANPSFWTSGTNVFKVSILKVNGSTDENPDNNVERTTFTQAKSINFTQPIRLRVTTNAVASDNRYRIKDQNGNIMFERNALLNNTTYENMIDFPAGCYTFEMEDDSNDGLSFWFYPNNGSGSMSFQRQITASAWAPVHSIGADFGGGVQFDFTLGAILDQNEPNDARLLSVYPNPATDQVWLELEGFNSTDLQVRILDMHGQLLQEKKVSVPDFQLYKESFNLENYPSGMYLMHITDGKRNYTQQIVRMD